MKHQQIDNKVQRHGGEVITAQRTKTGQVFVGWRKPGKQNPGQWEYCLSEIDTYSEECHFSWTRYGMTDLDKMYALFVDRVCMP